MIGGEGLQQVRPLLAVEVDLRDLFCILQEIDGDLLDVSQWPILAGPDDKETGQK